ncbi:MAG: NAD(+) synthase [Flavobacteriales bacterium]|nr:NAD(+) synthase [Flavobacteriales bacterium]
MKVEAVKEYIVNWLSAYIKESKTKGFVIGISGGVDSAVTSTLGALTNLPVLCVEMPIHQDKRQVTRAQNHISFLKENYPNVSSIETDLTPVFDNLTFVLPSQPENNLALANARARLRMTTLYYHAQINNYLVLGTGNKIEDFGIGFYTKYGDGGVDISPIADLTKTEVFELGKHLNIINEILIAPPTDGLWGDDRTDEDQIGASYPELEWAMDVVEKGVFDVTQFSPRQQEVFQIYTRLNTINQHKMQAIPVCVIPSGIK